ncbi:MAG: hypothetical protein ACOYBP_00960 [Microbacteriaceae bacterium]
MARLPIPGEDKGTWGEILNDFLSESHEPNGELKPDVVASPQLKDAAVTANKIADGAISNSKIESLGVADGVASLDADARQYRRQLPSALLAGLDSNARSVITFGLDHDDAAALAKRAPDLEAEDFMALGRHEIYLNLMHQGQATGWFSARTIAPSSPTTDAATLLRSSLERYGRAATDVDREIERAIGIGEDIVASDEPIGRRPKGGTT